MQIVIDSKSPTRDPEKSDVKYAHGRNASSFPGIISRRALLGPASAIFIALRFILFVDCHTTYTPSFSVPRDDRSRITRDL